MNIEIRDLSPAEADARLREGTLTIVDVRPPQERELAAIALPYAVLDAGGPGSLLAQTRDLPLGFPCHHGGRSAQAADHFHARSEEHTSEHQSLTRTSYTVHRLKKTTT